MVACLGALSIIHTHMYHFKPSNFKSIFPSYKNWSKQININFMLGGGSNSCKISAYILSSILSLIPSFDFCPRCSHFALNVNSKKYIRDNKENV